MKPVEQVNYVSTGEMVIAWYTATVIIDMKADPPFAVLHHIRAKVIVWCIATDMIDQ